MWYILCLLGLIVLYVSSMMISKALASFIEHIHSMNERLDRLLELMDLSESQASEILENLEEPNDDC